MPSETDIAWAAGLFEGEGSIRFYRSQWTLKLGMTDLDVVLRFQTVLGYGNVRLTKKAEPHHKEFFEWTCGKQNDCREIITWFWPYLGERRKARWNDVLQRRFTAFAPKICPACEKEYVPRRRAQVCCSQKCAGVHTRKVGKYTDRGPNKSTIENGYSSKSNETRGMKKNG